MGGGQATATSVEAFMVEEGSRDRRTGRRGCESMASEEERGLEEQKRERGRGGEVGLVRFGERGGGWKVGRKKMKICEEKSQSVGGRNRFPSNLKIGASKDR